MSRTIRGCAPRPRRGWPGWGSRWSRRRDPPEPRPARPAVPIDQCRVLYVEDHPRLRAQTEARLAGMGLSVVAAADGQAALAVLDRGERFDLLFTDIVMPGGVDGIRLAEEARRRLPGIRILYTTGYAGDQRLTDAAGEPGAALLRKPFAKAALREKLQALLR